MKVLMNETQVCYAVLNGVNGTFKGKLKIREKSAEEDRLDSSLRVEMMQVLQ
jgi:hypothetical protein